MIVENEIVLEQPDHIYREVATGEIIPGVTTILRAGGYIDADYYSETARVRGTAAHLAIHFLEKGTLDPFSLDPMIEPFVESYEKFKKASGFLVLYHEKIVFHNVYRYAGSLDSVGLLNGSEVILDFKTGEVQPWAALQLALYNACLPPPANGKPRKRMGLRLYPDGSIGRCVPFTDPQDEFIGLSTVAQFYWKQKYLKRKEI